MLGHLEIRPQVNMCGQCVDLYVFDVAFGHKRRLVKLLESTEMEEGMRYSPSLSIGFDQAQALMDSLWRCGLRPTEADSPGALAATKAHLEDMRRLVFKEEQCQTSKTTSRT